MGLYFGTDGIRGAFGQWPLIPEFFLKLGLSVSQVLNPEGHSKTFVVGRDTRQSGEILQSSLVAGLLSGGIDVIDVGVFPTAGIAWIVRRLNLAGGVVISASHNPVEQNGVKFIDTNGQKFPENLEAQIESLLSSTAFSSEDVRSERLGKIVVDGTLREIYIQGLLDEHPRNFLHGLKLVLDCSNGAASAFAPSVFSQAGAEVIALAASPDGKNINQRCGSERARRAPTELGLQIRQFGAIAGMAFDGDADRVVFVDANGSLIDGDHMLGFLANYLERHDQLAGGAVVTTQMRNTGLKMFLEGKGLTVFETPVGDKYVVEKLLEIRSGAHGDQRFGLGGEQAGHIDIVNDLFTTGDGIRTGLFVLRAFLESGESNITEFASEVGKTPQIIASAHIGQGSRYERQFLKDLEENLLTQYRGLYRANLRYSGTEPLFRVMLESDGQNDVNQLAQIAWRLCREAQELANEVGAQIDILNCTQGGVIAPDPDW